jgi:hypothetical protein
MQTSWRVAFLIVAASAVMHISPWKTAIVLFGYWGFEHLDNRLARREKEKAIADEIEGWTPDPSDLTYEDKGEMSRVRLSGSDQIIVARVAEILRRI